MSYLSVTDLSVRFTTEDGIVQAVSGMSFELERGRTLGIVGESGSGKSVTNLAILGMHDPKKADVHGRILLDGTEIVGAPESVVAPMRGRKVAMVFQNALSALSPYYTVGEQLAETYRRHLKAPRQRAWARAVEMLDRVGIPHPDQRAKQYPHEFSGGMRQRAMIALALVCDPELVVADEPTTALDVTVQAQILDLFTDLQAEFGTAIIFITHDLGVVAQAAHDVMVMYGGRAVEKGTVEEVLKNPRHPYTRGLMNSAPHLTGPVGADLTPIPGMPPSLINLPPGCAFHPRCPLADEQCRTTRPELTRVDGNGSAHLSACWKVKP